MSGIEGLHQGRLFMLTKDALLAYDVAGPDLAPRGWVIDGGVPQRLWRPR